MFERLCANKKIYALVLMSYFLVDFVAAQDYEVTEIQCTYSIPSSIGTISKDTIAAKLRKPDGFKGHPLFADDRSVDPEADPVCQIRPDLNDPTGLKYNLRITDFSRCGVLKRNGYVHVRVWFPQFPGVVMQADQELIIMCKPPEPTVVENKAAGFAGSFPHGARVSGVVEETPGRLEYEVALYKEAPATRLSSNSSSNNNELPVDQAVPIVNCRVIDNDFYNKKSQRVSTLIEPTKRWTVPPSSEIYMKHLDHRHCLTTCKPDSDGTKLQLRARISPESAWKYVKLMEVTVSPDPDDPHAIGSVALVKDGCRNRDFASIIPHQPARYRERHNEVFLDFEAFLLSSMKERSTLWIHSQIKACMDLTDCQPDFCLDLFEPAGHGRRKRRHTDVVEIVEIENPDSKHHRNRTNMTQFTKILGNLEYTVLMPGEFYHRTAAMESSCSTFLAIAAILGCLLFLSAFIMCWLATRLHTALIGAANANKNIDDLVRETRHYSETCYTGRATTQ